MTTRATGPAPPAPEAEEQEQIRLIPLSDLKFSNLNVRRSTTAPKDIERLANSIATDNLLQNLVVEPDREEDGKYRVLGGERRLRALRLLAEDGRTEWSRPVLCRVENTSPDDARNLSLIENIVRENLNPMDEAEAYAASAKTGSDISACAMRFGVTERRVRQRIRLAGLAEGVKEALRGNEIPLDLAEAFTVTSDHAEQTRVLERVLATALLTNGAAPGRFSYTWSASGIRRELTSAAVTAASSAARFVGIEAYQAAGGRVEPDLFSTATDAGDEETAKHIYLADRDILDRLVAEKLETHAAQVRGEQPWKWVNAEIDPPHLQNLNRIGRPAEPTGDDREHRTTLCNRVEELREKLDSDADERAMRRLRTDIRTATDEIWFIDQKYSGRRVVTKDEAALSGVIIYLSNGAITVAEGVIAGDDVDEAMAHAKQGNESGDAPIRFERSFDRANRTNGDSGESLSKAEMKAAGLTSANAAVLRTWRKNVATLAAAETSTLVFEALIAYQYWRTAATAEKKYGAVSGPLGLETNYRIHNGFRQCAPGDPGSNAAEAAVAVHKIESDVDLSWLDAATDRARFETLLAFPPRKIRKLFRIAVSRWMRPQLVGDEETDGAIEGGMSALGIDWTDAARPDEAHWLKVPAAAIKATLNEILPGAEAKTASAGSKKAAAAAAARAFSDPDNLPTEAARCYTIPGLDPDVPLRTPGTDPASSPEGKTEAGTDGATDEEDHPETEPATIANTEPVAPEPQAADTAAETPEAIENPQALDRTESDELPAFMRS